MVTPMYTYRKVKMRDGSDSPDVIQRIEDGAFIPNDPENVDCQLFRAWIDSGNTPQPSNPLPAPDPMAAVTKTILQDKNASADAKISAIITIFGLDK